jgi:alkaline phosphatase D
MKIVFTSCMDASRLPSQPVWTHVQSLNPDVLMLLGDQIYMDWFDLGTSNWRRAIDSNTSGELADFAQAMHARYQQQAAVPEFQGLLQNMAAGSKQVVVTWDDHDFAWNDSLGDPRPIRVGL